MKIHHIAYAVGSIEKSSLGFQKLGYVEIQQVMEDSERGILISFMKHEESNQIIELIEPVAPENPIKNFLKKMKGIAAPYHICYEVVNLDEAIAKQMEDGFIVTAMPAPAVAIQGKKVAFMIHKSVGLIELVEIV